MFSFLRPRSAVRARRRTPSFRPVLETLEAREVPALPPATATIAVMGDSLSASYQGTPQGAAGDRSWVQLL
jgi:hypothetical protein